MSALFIALTLLASAALYRGLIKSYDTAKKLFSFTLIYLIVFTAFCGISSFAYFPAYSDIQLTIICCAYVGMLVRIGVYYFRKIELLREIKS